MCYSDVYIQCVQCFQLRLPKTMCLCFKSMHENETHMDTCKVYTDWSQKQEEEEKTTRFYLSWHTKKTHTNRILQLNRIAHMLETKKPQTTRGNTKLYVFCMIIFFVVAFFDNVYSMLCNYILQHNNGSGCSQAFFFYSHFSTYILRFRSCVENARSNTPNST